jgi:hypothetical protein
MGRVYPTIKRAAPTEAIDESETRQHKGDFKE